ncbi:hypothetical protein Ae201684P_012859 [Aphanomyces euteiches]|nr:hypothetical protein Ae201684P_012859 [Aphanomyces euteiches]
MLPAAAMRPLEEADMFLSEEADRILQTQSHLRVLVERFGKNSLVVKSLYLHQFNCIVAALEELTRAAKTHDRKGVYNPSLSPLAHRAATNQEQLLRDLRRWLQVHTNIMDISLKPDCDTWRDCALYADPVRREQGMRWITESMYRKTDAIFQAHGLRPNEISDIFCDFKIAFEGNDTYNVTQIRQAELDVPFETVLDMHQTHLGATFMLDYFHPSGFEVITHWEYFSPSSRHKPRRLHASPRGIFHEKDRTVIVVRQIEDDEAHNNRDFCQRTCRLDIRRVPRRKKTRMRTLTMLSQTFSRDGYVPLEEEAARWGLDLTHVPPEHRQDYFAAQGVARFNARVGLRRKQLMDLAQYAKQTKIRPFEG